eukprot:TRINITY_DN19822_c0_g1_i3.p1 TRINITY_DN19822_c0_g1~~TRINITY_DN19822_c0_g1_i3.p1  ORF type:complete len:111 (-),score=18.72 TRINITY_DN19822_c0_g1_i3:834-1166(-)
MARSFYQAHLKACENPKEVNLSYEYLFFSLGISSNIYFFSWDFICLIHSSSSFSGVEVPARKKRRKNELPRKTLPIKGLNPFVSRTENLGDKKNHESAHLSFQALPLMDN